MRQSSAIQLFLAVTATATIAVGCAPSNPTVQSSPTPSPIASARAEGGEGGEGGEGETTGNPDVDLMTNLGLMKGHLMVAQELIDQKKYKEAEPHIGHPVEEIYGSLEATLTARQLPQFKDQLNKLNDLIKTAPDSPELPVAYKTAMTAIDGTIAAVPATQRQSPDFVLKVMSGLLNTAADEYKAAIADGKFVELVEYQDSRGFVQYAALLYAGIAEAQAKADPAKHASIEKALTELKTVWPTVGYPAAPVKTPAEVTALVKAIVPEQIAMQHQHH
jgi:flagellin-specific chaperone FliS